PLLLQPLVENAIHHGLEPCVAGGHIAVRAWRSRTGNPTDSATRSTLGGHLHLQVSDTGQGTAAAHGTSSTGTNTSPSTGTGFGLAQVRERLATTYGPAASLTLIANKPTGTSANVQIPL
ncbi:MAG: ATP-binding protein, partial [Flavobacterium sp.]|nr:ATP-binding protein [Flavobacterium sp.]